MYTAYFFRLESSSAPSSGASANFPPDPYFLPLVAVCSLLAIACLSVMALLIRSW
jgi:hypothetical protein